jgi:AraC-like DNA-binding protein
MAIYSYECRIITGGITHCDQSWNKTRNELDQCFKIYHPIKGEAKIDIDNVLHTIEEGNTYFISGYKIISQSCDSFMDILWLHFVPESLYLRRLLIDSEPFIAWSNNDLYFLKEFDHCIQKIFKGMNYLSPTISSLPYSYEEARLQSFILYLLADILKNAEQSQQDPTMELYKLKPSIDFMNKEFRRNPSLEELAEKSDMAPNYFHRVVKRNFGITPFNYMLRLRMDIAIKLLTSTSLSIKEIAFKSGYDNEFYFYRLFKKQFNFTPGKLKRMRPF